MFRALLVTCLTLLVAVAAWFSFGQPRPQADFVYANPAGINTLDPAQLSWLQDIRVSLNIWEGLTTYDPQTLEPMEGVANFPPETTEDGLTYVFHLRPEARWSNGDPVTSEDFVRAWRRVIEPGTALDYATFVTDFVVGAKEYYDWRNQTVAMLAEGGDADDREANYVRTGSPRSQERAGSPRSQAASRAAVLRAHADETERRWAEVGIKATDTLTLTVRLRRPCAYFLSLTAFATLVPIHESIELLRERHDGLPINEQGLVVYDPQWTKPDYHAHGYRGLVTNGPYFVKEWTFKDHMLLEANPHYWDRAALGVQTIDIISYGDINSTIMGYEQGDLDCLLDMTVAYDHELTRLAQGGEREDFHVPIVLGSYFYNYNCRDAEVLGRKNPFVDARVRKAFSLAIDKKLLVENVVRNANPPSNHLIPPGMIPGYSSPAGLDFDPAEARRLLSEAGYPGGAGLPPIEVLYNTGFKHDRVCQVLARMWEQHLGARVELRGKETKTFADDKQKHNFMIARAAWYADYVDPTTFLDICVTGNGNNDSGYSNPAYDELLRHASRENDAVRRMELLSRAEAILIQEDFPNLPIYTYTNLMAIKPYVSGIYLNPRLHVSFKHIRIQKELPIADLPWTRPHRVQGCRFPIGAGSESEIGNRQSEIALQVR